MGDLPRFESIDDYAAEIIRIATISAVKAVTPHLTTAGPGLPLPLDGAPRLSPDAPPETKSAATFLWAMERLADAGSAGEMNAAVTAAFVAGAMASESWLAGTRRTTLSGIVDLVEREQEARQRGGRSTRKLTPEIESFALATIAEEMRGNKVSKDAACRRTAPKILEKYGVELSPKTISRILAAGGG